MTLDFNDGSRPNLIELGRRATGEIDGELPTAYADALEDAARQVAPFDAEILRAAAHRIDTAHTHVPPPARRWGKKSWWMAVMPMLAAAAALTVAVLPSDSSNRVKGRAHLSYYVLHDGQVLPGDEETPLRAGDRIQFAYDAAGADTLVVLGVDGSGALTVYWPDRGDMPVATEPGGTRLLDESIELDDAPGPELFVAFFGIPDVEEATDDAADAWSDGGINGLLRMAEERPDVDLVVVPKVRLP